MQPEVELKLPPLVLHPFSRPADAAKLLECSRASLMLQNLVPRDGRSDEELRATVVEGRYCEMRMLFYIGRDLSRWIGQCLETADHGDRAGSVELRFQSFAALLTGALPKRVEERLRGWGVYDYRRMFARALGLNAVFREMPAPEDLNDEFVAEYQCYADSLFSRRQQLCPFRTLDARTLDLSLYTSSEYSEILEQGF